MIDLSITAAAPGSYLTPATTAAGAIFAAIIAGWVALRTHRKSLFIQHVTAERAKWRADLRKDMAALSVQIHRALNDSTDDLWKFHAARCGILLRINPLGRMPNEKGADLHPLDRIIHKKLAYLALAITMEDNARTADPTRRCILRELRLLEYAVQELLKNEWEKSKIEAEKGRLTPLRTK